MRLLLRILLPSKSGVHKSTRKVLVSAIDKASATSEEIKKKGGRVFSPYVFTYCSTFCLYSYFSSILALYDALYVGFLGLRDKDWCFSIKGLVLGLNPLFFRFSKVGGGYAKNRHLGIWTHGCDLLSRGFCLGEEMGELEKRKPEVIHVS